MIIVCSLSDLVTVCESVKPKYLISVIDPGYEPETPQFVQNHLKLGFDDIIKVSPDNHIFRLNTEEVPQLPPNNSHIDSIEQFTVNWDVSEDIVIHCWCGVSRSMATATYLMCKKNIKDIDTTGVKPLSNVLEQFSDSRDDTPKKSVDRDCALKNAPDTDGVFFQVPPTIKHNKEMKNEKK